MAAECQSNRCMSWGIWQEGRGCPLWGIKLSAGLSSRACLHSIQGFATPHLLQHRERSGIIGWQQAASAPSIGTTTAGVPRALSRAHTACTRLLLPLPGTPATPTSQGDWLLLMGQGSRQGRWAQPAAGQSCGADRQAGRWQVAGQVMPGR